MDHKEKREIILDSLIKEAKALSKSLPYNYNVASKLDAYDELDVLFCEIEKNINQKRSNFLRKNLARMIALIAVVGERNLTQKQVEALKLNKEEKKGGLLNPT